MTKHTPGPWLENWVRPNKAEGHTFDPTCSILATDQDGRRIRLADIPDPLTPEEEANARLIAAAPELLAALCGTVRALETLAGELGRGADPVWSLAAGLDAARAAIAKATE